jgi:hypothetical protein
MSVLESLQDDWLDEDQAELLGALTEFINEVGGGQMAVGETVSAEQAGDRLRSVQEQGWFEFITDEGTSTLLYSEAIKRLHRRAVPVQAPVHEVFAALRVLRAAQDPDAAELLGRVISGDTLLVLDIDSLLSPRALGVGGGSVPFGDALQSLVVVAHGEELALHVVDPSQVPTSPASLVDPTLPASRLGGTGTRVAVLAAEEWDRVSSEALLSQAAAFVGQSQVMMNSTLEFLTAREQFGVPIGSFQALRHRAADVAADVYAAQQLSIHLAEAFEDASDRRQLGLIGRSVCGRAAVKASSEAVQLRGGMGFTWEDGTHWGLKRIMSLALTGGSLEDCEHELGLSIIGKGRPRWAGGLDNA